MIEFILPIHITAASLVIGSLFIQSLMVVMAMRLKSPAQIAGTRIIQRRIHLFIYYPILLVALGSGLWTGILSGALAAKWLHWKLVLVVVLIGLGFLIGRELRLESVSKRHAMMVHVVIFLVSLWLVYLTALKPY